ncbi:hypothetical protein CP533_4877 [Ophiocordyceps camponoti-saundersi (nom. inval.)]|nr:hypothetical protein CP533_4877 [Ophiocordyceps camponoti-saundersi (nom. inval.)]
MFPVAGSTIQDVVCCYAPESLATSRSAKTKRLSKPLKMHLAVFILLVFALLFFPTPTLHRRYPPGPRPLPINGNLHQILRRDPWRKIKEWHQEFGPLVTVCFGLRPIVFLGSHRCVTNLLQRRGSIHSSRPAYFAQGLGSELLTVGLPYGPRLRLHRRLVHSFLNRGECERYVTLQDIESKQLLHELLSTTHFGRVFHRFSASLTFALAYGQRLEKGTEDEIVEIDQIMRELLDNLWLPSVAFPLLDYIPPCFAPWKRASEALSKRQANFFLRNFERALHRSKSNWSKHLRQQETTNKPDLTEMAYIIGTLYEAGSDTTAFVLHVFVLACVLHPSTVHQAQHELDSVLGLQIPELQDFPRLSYVNAFVQEVLRWRPVVPGGIQRATARDDVYQGYEIPRGTVLVPNHWSLEFDEEVFYDPWAFKPERWIEKPDLPCSAFGFGRRKCPGQNLARNSLKLVISRMLWAFDFDARKMGGSLPDAFKMTQGISSRPEDFEFEFCTRSERHGDAIRDAYREIVSTCR